MLDEQWDSRTLPDDPEAIADLIAPTDAHRAEVLAAWTAVRRKFATMEDQPGRIQNLRLERCRREYRKFKADKRKGGKTRAEQAARANDGTFQSPVDHQQASSSTPAGAPAAVQQRSPADIQPASALASASSSALASASAEHGDVAFERFRAAYPKSRQQGGSYVEHAFVEALGRTTVDRMLAALDQHKRSEQWQKPQLIPSMTTWLTEQRWTQELPEPTDYGLSSKTAGNMASLQRWVDQK